MRGILECWIKQAHRVELFKQRQCSAHALHCKFHLHTGEEIYSDDKYNHLQIDVVSIYLIFLVQMITSGLQIVYTQDEVAFVQNLVYYVERAYRTPDYGMWERGSKYNDGTPEIHASSIGMAKSALEAINGCNLFGEKGASWSVVYVDIDAHNRNRSIFETMLPRESSSKGVDSALLSTLSFPAFASHEERLVDLSKNNVINRLRGKKGFKRFSRDGYLSRIEDHNRKYYNKAEIKDFEGNECEWPMFYTYMIIDGVFKNCNEQIEEYQMELRKCMYSDLNGGWKNLKFHWNFLKTIFLVLFRSRGFNVLRARWRRHVHSFTLRLCLLMGPIPLHHSAIAHSRSPTRQRARSDSSLLAQLQSSTQRRTLLSFPGESYRLQIPYISLISNAEQTKKIIFRSNY